MSQLRSSTALALMSVDSAGSTSDSLRTALLSNIEGLALLDVQLAAARADEKRAHDILAEATAARETVKTRVLDILQQMASVSASMERIKRSLHTLSHFPVELLSLIFEWANTDDGSDDYEEAGLLPREINTERLKLPWRLAAVCTHWRKVVCQLPVVWSYVAIPDYGHAGARGILKPLPFRNTDRKLFSHLDLLLRRSSRASIDVVICVGRARGQLNQPYENVASDEYQFIDNLLARLSSHLHQVRTLYVDGRGYDPTLHQTIRQPGPEHLTTSVNQKFVNFLRAPTPRLVDLRLNFATDYQPYWHGFPETPLPMLLPQAPKLRTLSVCHVPIALRSSYPARLPSLRQLKLDIHRMHGVALSDTFLATPALEELTLSIEENIPVEGWESIQLPDLKFLRVLHILTRATFELLDDGACCCPNLTSLALSGVADLSVTPELARRLRSLVLSDCEDLETHVPLLRELDHLEVVELSHCTMQDEDFFAAFCDADRPMWPRLAVLRLWRVHMNTVDQDGILQFMRKRCSPENQSRWKQLEPNPPANAYPRPLAALRSDRSSVPMWVLVQIQDLYPEPEETAATRTDHHEADLDG